MTFEKPEGCMFYQNYTCNPPDQYLIETSPREVLFPFFLICIKPTVSYSGNNRNQVLQNKEGWPVDLAGKS